jgi:poly-gamma-glutamate capsule biosynthesis protein CapA/YwtB (metallophosphatase superfamily)
MSITIALAGDTMLGRGVADEIDAAGPHGLFSAEIRELFSSADLGVLNLECCISRRGTPWDGPEKLFHFRAPPQAVDALTELGVDCVTLANNHALDYGETALADTLASLSAAGIAVTGAGADLEQARAPAMLQADGLTVAIAGLTDHPAEFAATADRPGVRYVDLHAGVPPELAHEIRALAAACDVLIVMPHWGPNMTIGPMAYIRSAARTFTQAGATLVAGSSAHLFHGVAGRVIYDLGDFIDDYMIDDTLRNDLGLLYLVTLDEQVLTRIEAVPLRLHYARTELAAGADRDWILTRFGKACTALGTSVRDEDGRLVAISAWA